MKFKEFVALIDADVWRQVRQRGSHRQYHHATRRGTVTIGR